MKPILSAVTEDEEGLVDMSMSCFWGQQGYHHGPHQLLLHNRYLPLSDRQTLWPLAENEGAVCTAALIRHLLQNGSAHIVKLLVLVLCLIGLSVLEYLGACSDTGRIPCLMVMLSSTRVCH